jgi:hypothetical protein
VHGDARRALIAGYLEANVKDHRPPRFLLNDLFRYWRTIAVDFESKMRARKGRGLGASQCQAQTLDAFVDRGALDPGVRALDAYDEFLAVLDDRANRRELSDLGVEEATESPLFARIAELGKEFEAGLLALLFDDPELRRWVREYLVF